MYFLQVKVIAKYGMWIAPLFNLFVGLNLAGAMTMWVGIIFLSAEMLVATAVNAIFYGQVTARLRHQLAGVENIFARLGYLCGVLVGGLYTAAWLNNFNHGDRSYPDPPLVVAG